MGKTNFSKIARMKNYNILFMKMSFVPEVQK